jgi:hypothetical protein
MIPRLTMPLLLKYAEGRLDLSDVKDRRPTLISGDSNRLISIEANRAMERSDGGGILAGSIVTIDTLRLPEPGDIVVVVLLATGEFLFGRYRPGPTHIADEFTLRSDNPDYLERTVTKKNVPRVVGTMCEVVALRSR